MGFLDGFIAGQIYNSTSNNNDRRDESTKLKSALTDEKERRKDQNEINKLVNQNYQDALRESNLDKDELRNDYYAMRASRDKFAKSMNLLKEEKKALLSKPLYEAVKENENWDLAYDKLTSSLATSHVFKEAYRDLAFKYGEQAGVLKDEIVKSVNRTAKDVFNERINKIDQMSNDPTIKDDYVIPKEILPRDRIERIVKSIKNI